MERLVPNTKKAVEDREEKPKVPARDPDDDSLADLVAGQQPQLQREHQPPNISEMKPLTREAYGGGMYANERARGGGKDSARPRAGATQSADGEREQEQQTAGRLGHGHPPPPSTGDRDLDITGQSYIQ